MSVRLRQVVLADRNFDSMDRLVGTLGLKAPYEDPGVAEFGLVNRVYAIGDQFLEIVVPVSEAAPAARFLKRNGPGGYMLIFQVDDLAAARARADAANIRRVWNIDLTDISASHLHPADMGVAIVSLDEARPAASWRWAGPDWEKRSAPGRISAVTIESPEPDALLRKWAQVLGADVHQDSMKLDDAVLHVGQASAERLTSYSIEAPDGRTSSIDLASAITFSDGAPSR